MPRRQIRIYKAVVTVDKRTQVSKLLEEREKKRESKWTYMALLGEDLEASSELPDCWLEVIVEMGKALLSDVFRTHCGA